MIDLHLGDAVQWALGYTGEPFHALLCDAPYEMAFMGKGWDASGVAFDPETWKAFARVLHPGAFLFVCAGTINDDLISVAMREAGLRKFHKMGGWVYGSGFPKASRIDTQIDKAAGVEREVIGSQTKARSTDSSFAMPTMGADVEYKEWDITAPATDLARAWAGHRYGLQALKPALETVLIFQKPYEGKAVDCITRTGAGALNVDGSRIGSETITQHGRNETYSQSMSGKNYAQEAGTNEHQGRWPANFFVSDQTAPLLDAQSGELKSGKMTSAHKRNGSKSWFTSDEISDTYGDSGGASRFFFRVAETLEDAELVRYCAKASRRERDAGLEGFELHSNAERDGRNQYKNGANARNGSGKPINGNGHINPMHNPHPTVKPLSLCKYLATLLLPPAEYAPRRLFVPFAGVASECIGAMQAGWEHVEGVELTEEYMPIAQARVEYWTAKQAEEQQQPPLFIPERMEEKAEQATLL